MSKEIIYGSKARECIASGVEKIASAVKITLGPKGRNVVIDRQYASPLITNDGVTIAKSIDLDNKFEKLGADIIKEVCTKTNDMAGDGTTTAIVLAESIVKKGIKNITAGASPTEIKSGIEEAVHVVLDELSKQSKSIETYEEIVQVGTISSGDQTIGELIAKAIDNVGKDGAITIEENTTGSTELKIVEGLQFDRGMLSPYFSTITEKQTAELDDPYIFLTDKKISSLNEILPVIEPISNANKKLLIIADDIENEALAGLVLNKIRGLLNVVVVKSPSFGEKRKEIMQDIAILTGATIVSGDLGLDFSSFSGDMLGEAKKVIVDVNSTTIIEGHGNKDEIEDRKKQIKFRIENLTSDFEKEQATQRLSKLCGGVAIIKVGGATEIEMQEKKLRVEDALNATKSATKEGIVAGGGIALVKASIGLNDYLSRLSGDIKTGAQIVLDSLSAPLEQIAQNSGKNGGVILDRCKSSASDNIGYDAKNDRFVNMFDAGIIDPAKVTKSAIKNAGSVASVLMTTECIVADNAKENK